MEKILTGKHNFVFLQHKDELLGRGSFSRVYKGLDIDLKSPVAIKCIDCANLSANGKRKLEDEINLCKTLDHPNIVQTRDILKDESTDYLYIVLERCDCDLSQYLKNIRGNRPLSERRVLRYMCQLSQAFQYLQSRNIIHRDLKPQNILMLDNFKTLKLADFGMARSLNENEMAETICGSPLYMAPEVLLKKQYSQKADLWSLGMIMYELLFGKHPFRKATSHFQLLHQMQNGRISWDKHVKISQQCQNLLRSILQTDAQRRIGWEDFFNHPWFIEKEVKKIRCTEKPMTFSQEVEQEMYGEFRISLGNSETEQTSSNVSSYSPDDETEGWNKYIIDENYSPHHAKSEPMAYTIMNPETDTPSSLGQSIITYMTTSFDLIRGSAKYFNSL